MKITVIGCGRWGSFIASYLCEKKSFDVTLYGRKSSEAMSAFIETRRNEYMTLPEEIKLSTELSCINDSDIIVISVNSQGLRSLMEEISQLRPENKIFVLCMKGIENTTGKRLSEICKEAVSPSNKVAVWLGPGHVQEFTAGIPNCMVIDSECEETKKMLVDEFSGELIRFYYGEDLIGNEIGAAAKNVIGIAAGILDGMKLSTLKGALMSRGTREIARLINALGGSELSAYGLCHLGDYEATVFSKYSHNRQFGESFVLKEPFDKLAEGYYTAKAIKRLSLENNVETPICTAVYEVLYEGKDVNLAMSELFNRSVKTEFYK